MREKLTKTELIVVIGLTLLLFSTFQCRWQTRTMQYEVRQLKNSVDSMRVEVKDREFLDSLYYDHLKDCSFIDQESVKVGSRGVLYSAYHKSNGRIK